MKRLRGLVFLFPLFFTTIVHSQELNLLPCEVIQYEINDNTDMDGDGNTCEAIFSISNIASYSNGDCPNSSIQWEVIIDLDNDGTDDLEYSSTLPSDDDNFDDTNGNGIPDLYIPPTTNNLEQSIMLEIEGAFSEHSIRWNVNDDCDLEAVCETNFEVIDKRSPTPFCISISTIVYDDVDLMIYAEDFNIGAFDNCTNFQDILFSFDSLNTQPSRLITCEDVENSPLLIEVYAIDEAGNFDFCVVFISVLPGPTVDCFEEGDIRGNVSTYSGDPIANAVVTLNANLPEFPREEITDQNGNYNFENIPGNLDCTLSVQKDGNFLMGVSTLDLVIIMRHLLGLQAFSHPYAHFASDINGDQQIRVSDLILLRKLLLGIFGSNPFNTSWIFFDATHTFADPEDPFSDPPLSEIEFLHTNESEIDFIGVKVGDVNN